MWLRRVVMFLCLVMLVGCAATTGATALQVVQPPTPAVAADIAVQLDTVQVPADKALIYLYRPKRFVGSANTYKITLNGTPVAEMRTGTRLPYPVPPGYTTLQGSSLPNILNLGLALGMMEKPNIAFDAEAGKVYFIDVKTGFAGGPQFEFVDAAKGLEAIKGMKLLKHPSRSYHQTPPERIEKKPEDEVSYPHKLTGDEIRNHFQHHNFLIFDRAPGTDFTLKILSFNDIERECDMCNEQTGYGVMTIKASQNQVCFDWDNVSYPSSTCFDVMQVEDNRYQLIDSANNETYGYKVP